MQPQEIRAAIYHGEFNNMLEKLNRDENWRNLYGKKSPRKRDQELILRFVALYYADKYEKPMVGFLNSFMGKNKHLSILDKEKLTSLFTETVDVINQNLGSRAFKPKRALNAAILDSVMVAIAKRLEKNSIQNGNGIRSEYEKLLNDPDYVKVTNTATTDEENVRKRIELATKAFENVR